MEEAMENSKYKVRWSMNCVYPRYSTITLHTHHCFHYLYVKDGEGTMQIGDTLYDLKPEHIYLTPPLVPHEIKSYDVVLSAYEVKFTLFDSDFLEDVVSLPNELNLADTNIEGVFESLFVELRNSDGLSDKFTELKFEELLYTLIRKNQQNSASEEGSTGFSHAFASVLAYMESNISKEIALQDLADTAHMEKIYFLKRFKAELRETPMSYLRKLRINKAKKLLVNSDMNVTQISAAVGFQSIHHFTGVFKKSVGMSPTEYKDKKKHAHQKTSE